MIRASLDQPGLADQPDQAERRLRRDAQVEQQRRLGPELPRGGVDRAGEQRRVGVGDVDVAEALREVLALLGAEAAAAEVVAGLQGERPEVVVAHLRAGGADDAERRQQARLAEVQQSREELALGEVPGRAEQHDHVRRHVLVQGVRPMRLREDDLGIALTGLVHRQSRSSPRP